jgi:serine phosphatase RsbU (regulator of sigma subunit)
MSLRLKFILGPGFTARVVEAVNRELCARNPSFMFVTLQVLLLDVRTGAVEIANAGHLPPWRLDADGATPLPEAPSLALGIDPDMTYTSETAQLRPGEALALLTDGVIEARDRDGELFGEERLVHRRIQRIQLGGDLVGGLGPDEGRGIVVVLIDVAVDGRLQLDDRAEDATP